MDFDRRAGYDQPQMLDKLRRNQPAFSTVEFFILLFAADIPRYIGQAIAIRVFGVSEWPAFGVGLAFGVAAVIAYFVIR